MPPRFFTGTEKEVDRGRMATSAILCRIAECLDIETAFGMWLQIEQPDDVVGGHAGAWRKGFAAPRPMTALKPATTPCASASASCLRPANVAPAASATSQACLPLRSMPCSANHGTALK